MPAGHKSKGRLGPKNGPPAGPPSKKSMARFKQSKKQAGEMLYRESDDVAVTSWMNKVDSKPRDVTHLERQRKKREIASAALEDEDAPVTNPYDALLQSFQLSNVEEARKAVKKRKREASEADGGRKELPYPSSKRKRPVDSDEDEMRYGRDEDLEDDMLDELDGSDVDVDDVEGDEEAEMLEDSVSEQGSSEEEDEKRDRQKHEANVRRIRKMMENDDEEMSGEEEVEEDDQNAEVEDTGSDVYDLHFGREFSKAEMDEMESVPIKWIETESQHQFEGVVWRDSRTSDTLPVVASSAEFHVHPKVSYSWKQLFGDLLKGSLTSSENNAPHLPMTQTQQHLFSLMNSYSDVLYCLRTPLNGLEIMSAYALHVANHITKTLDRQRANNHEIHDLAVEKRKIKAEITKLKQSLDKKNTAASEPANNVATKPPPVLNNDVGSDTEGIELPIDLKMMPRVERVNRMKELHAKLREDEVEFRDQGFTKPVVLVLLPMKNAALEFVELLLKAMPRGMVASVENRRKFYGDYFEDVYTSRAKRPLEWLATFRGNTDDTFRLGISFRRNKSTKLYSGFYKSDIIVASPLGLRLAVDEKEQGAFDYLSSLEMVIVDQSDVMLMQNWEHVLWVFERMSQLPQKTREEIDFSRVRHYFLNRQAKLYRQTLVFSSVLNVDLNSLFNRHCLNTFGRYKIRPLNVDGSVPHIISTTTSPLRQVFYRLSASSIGSADDDRFEYFTTQVWNHLSGSAMDGTLIMVPSYFDYLRLHKFFTSVVQHDEFNAVAVSEYTNETRAIKYRKHFYTGRAQIMLMTERYHFYKRIRIRGIKSLIWYSPPLFPALYSEIGNWVEEGGSILTLYTKYDILGLEGVVGRDRCDIMVSSERTTHSIAS